MRSFVGFIVDHDETTTDLDDIIVNTVTEYSVVDHEVRVDIGEDIEEITKLLGSLSWDERAKVDTLTHMLSELDDWAVDSILVNTAIEQGGDAIRALHQRVIDEADASIAKTCLHFDALNDPNHDCSKW